MLRALADCQDPMQKDEILLKCILAADGKVYAGNVFMTDRRVR